MIWKLFVKSSIWVLVFFSCGTKKPHSHKDYTLVMLQQSIDTRLLLDIDSNEHIESDELGEEIFTRIGLFTMDSILIYDYLNVSPYEDPGKYPFVMHLAATSDVHGYVLYFFEDNVVPNNRIKDSFEIVFEKDNVVKVGGDRYILNETYFNQLENSMFTNRNILDAICLLKDTPGEYNDKSTENVQQGYYRLD